jgi:uncharacterized SAM-binding protein YcdF (DUF218 family)
MIREESRRWKLLRLVKGAVTGLGLLVLIVTVTPIDKWWARKLAGEGYYSDGDVLVVLGGATFADGGMDWNSYLRTRYAGQIYRAGAFKQVIVSGGRPPRSKVATAVSIEEYLRCLGVPSEAIQLETASHSTRENALYSAQLLKTLPGRKVLLTSDYHMFRAYRAFIKAGVDVLPQPIPDVGKRAGGWMARWPAFVDLVTESGKIAYYWLRGWI